jgi:hypothetical protein
MTGNLDLFLIRTTTLLLRLSLYDWVSSSNMARFVGFSLCPYTWLTDWLRNIWLATRLIYNTQGVPGFGTKCSVSQLITLTSHIYNYHYLIKSESPSIYSRGWKFVYLVLKYTPFYSVLAGSVSLSQEKGVVICAHFSLFLDETRQIPQMYDRLGPTFAPDSVYILIIKSKY